MKIKSHEVFMDSYSYSKNFFSFSSFEQNFTRYENLSVKNAQPHEDREFTSEMIIKELSSLILRNLIILSKAKGVDVDFSYIEEQGVSFKTEAFIQAENRDICVDINLNLHSSFSRHFSTNKLNFFDPLVLNLDGSLPALSGENFTFDIDADGKEDQISTLFQNSAFLSLDKNNNQKIDNGNELFGVKSGNGFMDLRKYDEDSNNWIDENDEIFNKLRIWQKSVHEDKLLALGEVGIGAIYLGSSDTNFLLRSFDKAMGQIRSSGFFLKENGQSGIISQIDFAKQNTPKLEDVLANTKEKTISSLLEEKMEAELKKV